MIIQGVDSSNVARPLLLAADGSVIARSKLYDGANYQDMAGFSDGILKDFNASYKVHDLSGVTQIIKDGVANNATVVLYTVPANKVFYFYGWTMGVDNNAAAASRGFLYVRNGAAVVQFQWYPYVHQGSSNFATHHFQYPIKLIATWDIAIYSPAATVTCAATVQGIEL